MGKFAVVLVLLFVFFFVWAVVLIDNSALTYTNIPRFPAAAALEGIFNALKSISLGIYQLFLPLLEKLWELLKPLLSLVPNPNS